MTTTKRSFEEFIQDFGLKKFPFNDFSTENELSIKEKLFYMPSDYSPILQSFNSGQSMLILGNRGIGKTAMLFNLENRVIEDGLVISRMSDFSELKQSFTNEQFYSVIIGKITEELFNRLVNERSRISRLSSEQKMLLVYLFNNFFPVVSRQLLRRNIEKIRHNCFLYQGMRAYNLGRDLLNFGFTVAMRFTSDAIRQHFTALPPISDEQALKKYFPEIPYEVDKPLEKQTITFAFLERCLELVIKLGYSKFIITLDKIDEDNRLKNDAELIADFIAPVLTDNKLLLSTNIQIIVSLWSIAFTYLSDRVRSQKHHCTEIVWETEDLRGALNKRINVYAETDNKHYADFFDSDVTEEEIEKIFLLSNMNPRDLWHIFKSLFLAQYRLNPDAIKISKIAIYEGLKNFVTSFNYYEYYPRLAGADRRALDVYSYISHLLKVNKLEFTHNGFKEAAGVSGGSVSNYVGQMQRMGLIVDAERQGVYRTYRISDPKIQYAIENGFQISKVRVS